MARKPRIQFPNAFYHVIARGNQGQSIFHDDADRKRYINRLAHYLGKYDFTLYAYVLMDNHIHLLLETGVVPLSKIMQGTQFTYTQYYNRKYQQVGHLFQGRHKAILCDKDAYLLELIRYLHLNPVRVGIVKDPKDYPWSSHRSYLADKKDQLISADKVLSLFAPRRRQAIRRYGLFVLEGIKEGHRKDLYQLKEGRFLGDDRFVEETFGKIKEEPSPTLKMSLKEVVEILCQRMGIKEIELSSLAKRRKIAEARSIIGYLAVRYCGYNIKQVAENLHRDSVTISHGINQLETRIKENSKVAEFVKSLYNMLRRKEK